MKIYEFKLSKDQDFDKLYLTHFYPDTEKERLIFEWNPRDIDGLKHYPFGLKRKSIRQSTFYTINPNHLKDLTKEVIANLTLESKDNLLILTREISKNKIEVIFAYGPNLESDFPSTWYEEINS